MTEKKARGRQIHVEMPSDEYDLFKALAKEQDLSLQQLVRRCIRAYIEQGSAYQDTHPNLKIVPEEIFTPDYADDLLSDGTHGTIMKTTEFESAIARLLRMTSLNRTALIHDLQYAKLVDTVTVTHLNLEPGTAGNALEISVTAHRDLKEQQ
ncbi:phage repressor protein [Burkholderia cenocepacia]|uniref:phage repressor protein n=1 Tax=Burkholderia cenocepacia TaxID=95486 RepID=UPI000982289C|nr:phage repressor protein [Burkholderia cenocepacia]ONY02287.1 phage repressor protein [Burkholderia cenocepacia]